MTKQDVSSEDGKPQSQGWRFMNEFRVSGGESSELDLSHLGDLVGFGQAKSVSPDIGTSPASFCLLANML